MDGHLDRGLKLRGGSTLELKVRRTIARTVPSSDGPAAAGEEMTVLDHAGRRYCDIEIVVLDHAGRRYCDIEIVVLDHARRRYCDIEIVVLDDGSATTHSTTHTRPRE